MRSPAELDDLDRCGMVEMSLEDFERRATALNQIIRDRWVSEANVAALKELDRKAAASRRATRLAVGWFLACLAFAGLALYLRSIGE